MTNYDPLYLSINDNPGDIIAALDDLTARRAKTAGHVSAARMAAGRVGAGRLVLLRTRLCTGL